MIIRIVNARENPCPRCGGNLSINNDQFGDYLQCLMCNRSTDVRPTQGMYEHRPNPVLILDAPRPRPMGE